MSDPGRETVVRRMYESYNARDLARWTESAAPDARWYLPRNSVDGGGYSLEDATGERYFPDIDEAWERNEVEIVGPVEEAGDACLMRSRVRASGRGSGVRIDQEFWHVVRFRDDGRWYESRPFDREESAREHVGATA